MADSDTSSRSGLRGGTYFINEGRLSRNRSEAGRCLYKSIQADTAFSITLESLIALTPCAFRLKRCSSRLRITQRFILCFTRFTKTMACMMAVSFKSPTLVWYQCEKASDIISRCCARRLSERYAEKERQSQSRRKL